MRETIIKGLFSSTQKLEEFKILEVSSNVLSGVANIAVAAAKMGVKVDWMDKVLDEIIDKS